jgi:Reverse transcriptase (RNA-dependent DNA polymerase)
LNGVHKLESLGFFGDFLGWISSYLSGRTQNVRILIKIFQLVLIASGVPQGSHFGLLLFNPFIYDLSLVLKEINHLFYADD